MSPDRQSLSTAGLMPNLATEDCFHLGVKALIRNDEGKILLLQRSSRSKKTYWDIPGGRMQKGESQIETLRREVHEEIGLKDLGDIYALMMIHTDIRITVPSGDVGLIFSIFVCDISFTFQCILSEEHENYGWFSVLEVIQKIPQYPAEFLEKLPCLV